MGLLREVAVERPADGQFGFVLSGDAPTQLATVDPGGVAERCGLRAGDVSSAPLAAPPSL